MAITAAMVKELREMTGAGMMDCKKALTETNGDMDAAVDVLKKSGAAKMEKKQSRIAAEGIARVAVNGNVAVVAQRQISLLKMKHSRSLFRQLQIQHLLLI